MKRSKRTASVVCVTCASLLAAIAFWLSGDAAGEVLRPDGDPSGLKAPKSGVANAELSVSIFNDKLRRFKFRLEHTDVVTVEEAAAFMERYSSRDNPAIIGAYADPDANLLVVIGPPEAEQAIRNDLATAIIELQGIPGIPGNGNLKIQKRTLQSQG
jgi:hypothetical protein